MEFRHFLSQLHGLVEQRQRLVGALGLEQEQSEVVHRPCVELVQLDRVPIRSHGLAVLPCGDRCGQAAETPRSIPG